MRRSSKKHEHHNYDNMLVTQSAPKSRAAESYRMLRTNLLLSSDVDYKSLVVTSAGRNEGKSVTCANLAVVLSKAERSVCVIDADLRLPSIHRVFAVEATEVGVAQLVAAGQSDVDEIKKSVVNIDTNLDIIPAGPVPANPSEILGSARFATFLEAVRGMYDIVLIDTPPVGLVTDAAVLSKAVDGVVYVVSYQETRRRFVQRAMGELRTVHANVVGVVLNRYPADSDGYGGYERYYGGGDHSG